MLFMNFLSRILMVQNLKSTKSILQSKTKKTNSNRIMKMFREMSNILSMKRVTTNKRKSFLKKWHKKREENERYKSI